MLSGIIITLIVVVAAATGSMFKPGEWYFSLNKPSWTPPNWVFPVVWTLLYCMIAVAGWLVWELGATFSIIIWGFQLITNGMWSYIFFGMKKMRVALINIVFLIVLVVAFVFVTYPVSQLAAILFLPYLCWLGVAMLLNLRVIQLNPLQVK